MADLFDNPMGLCGFEFVEFASPTPGLLEPLFEKMGFTLVAKHRSKNVLLYRQNEINFIVNNEPRSEAGYFAAEGPRQQLVEIAQTFTGRRVQVLGLPEGGSAR